MPGLIRQSLQWSHQGLTRVNTKIAHLLNGKSTREKPYVTDLAQAYATGWADCPCVFVLSTGRVGTKTLAAVLALSPDVVATHEPEPRLVKASFDAYIQGGDIGQSETWRAVVLAARDDAICAASRRGKIYVETNPKLTALAKALAVSFPASRFILLHRHPYEVIRSSVRRGHYQGHNWDFARIRPRPYEPVGQEWETWSPTEKSAWRWARVNGEACDFLDTLPESRKLSLRADALFAQDKVAIRKLFAFAGVSLPPEERVKEVIAQKINAQRAGTYPPPAEWSEAEQQRVWDRVAEVARVLGYEA